MSDELKPRESVDSREFREALLQFGHACASYPIPDPYEIAGKAADLIAHIDAWGARLAGVPEGFVAVPSQPTQAMQTAGFSKMLEVGKREIGQIYAAMLAASPTPDKEPPCGS